MRVPKKTEPEEPHMTHRLNVIERQFTTGTHRYAYGWRWHCTCGAYGRWQWQHEEVSRVAHQAHVARQK